MYTTSDVGFPYKMTLGGPAMKRKRYTEEQIISIVKEHEAGGSVPELSRRHGVAENTIYRWKSKFGGMEVADAKKLRQLEAENAKLKRLYADAMLDNAALKELNAKKW
jgi:putative transposase